MQARLASRRDAVRLVQKIRERSEQLIKPSWFSSTAATPMPSQQPRVVAQLQGKVGSSAVGEAKPRFDPKWPYRQTKAVTATPVLAAHQVLEWEVQDLIRVLAVRLSAAASTLEHSLPVGKSSSGSLLKETARTLPQKNKQVLETLTGPALETLNHEVWRQGVAAAAGESSGSEMSLRGALWGEREGESTLQPHESVHEGNRLKRILRLTNDAEEQLQRMEASERGEEALAGAEACSTSQVSRLEKKIARVEREEKDEDELELLSRQQKLEAAAVKQSVDDYRLMLTNLCKSTGGTGLDRSKRLMASWFVPFTAAIRKEFDPRKVDHTNQTWGNFVHELKADKLAVITMHRLLSLCVSMSFKENHLKVTEAALKVGETVEQEVMICRQLKLDKACKDADVIDDLFNGTAAKGMLRLEKLSPEEEKQRRAAESMEQEKQRRVKLMKARKRSYLGKNALQALSLDDWTPEIRAKVGSRLIHLLMETAKVDVPIGEGPLMVRDGDVRPVEKRPAFRHAVVMLSTKPYRLTGTIQLDEHVKALLEHTAMVNHFIIYMPTIVKPKPWTDVRNGGHYYLRTTMVRTKSRGQKTALHKARESGGLDKIFQALNILGETPWRINTPVLQVVESLWAGKLAVAGLPDQNDLPVPPRPQNEEDKEVLKRWRREVGKVKRHNAEAFSLRCDMELKLKVARVMAEEKRFYYPHNLDFRGRAYPLHPHLHHLGSDVCRGLLTFAEARPLCSNGFRWLHIHMANVIGGGVDKLSFDGRVEHVEKEYGNIFQSAESPLLHRWWMEAEKPFQCLSCCIELRNAYFAPNREEYLCALPVHQDGSCNGLQHYAALGRDFLGAQSVNMMDTNKPADVYSGVAERVKRKVAADAADPKSPDHAIAKLLNGQVDRKLVKQTVMTSVYGVTYVGARTQIQNRLKERKVPCDDPDRDYYLMADYAAKATLSGLQELFEAAREIMKWLGECATLVARDDEKAVQWVTPLGLPVMQPYTKPKAKQVKTSLQSLTLRTDGDTVTKGRQKSAFPPNFVHSLDSTHMMQTAIRCHTEGIVFAGVHDSYWTHAGSVDRMSRILREEFVALHSRDLLQELLDQFQERHPAREFPPIPERGTYDLKNIMDATYFFN